MQVSIIIPVYNIEKYLRKCLDSVCAQPACVEEIILVNDGSADGSLEICKEYAETDERIVVIDGENQGVERAIITGVKAARGDYIGFVDGDDYIEPSMFGKLHSAITTSDADMAICGYDRVSEAYEFLSRYDLPPADSTVLEKRDGAFAISLLPNLSGKPFTSYSRCNKLFKRDAILGNEFFKPNNLRIGEDTALIYSLIFSLSKICLVNEPLYHYVQRKNSAIHSFDSEYVSNWETVVNILSTSADCYGYKIDNFDGVAAALLYHLCIGKVRLSKLPRKKRAEAYKLIGNNKQAQSLLRSVKLKMPFKRKLVFSLLKSKHYSLLSFIY